MLTERQEQILGMVVEAYLETGAPVGSKLIASMPEVEVSPSTLRNEFAELEREGYLTHPHTSAGRTPTDSGYRRYADQLLSADGSARSKRSPSLGISRVRREVEEALRETTEALAAANDLLALATAPPPNTATLHRIEVLTLQPRVVAVVAIASNGDVVKRLFTFEANVDSGLVEWASSFLNERLAGAPLGARTAIAKLEDPELGPSERHFLAEIEGAIADLGSTGTEQLYMDGTARLLSESHAADIPEPDGVVRALEGRVSVLSVLRSALQEHSVFLCIGEENPEPDLRSVSLVGAGYGLGYRRLGAVGVVGPLRMDYARAIESVREASVELSRFFATVYEG
ncbi:MAG: heat-inducible transcriptional repressor HrcA [Solirubrobacterales bacterium]